MGDPLYAAVKLRLTFDGVDGATTAPDLSLTPKILTFEGNAQIDTGQSKFGGASLQFGTDAIFLDTFTETANTQLDAHTPDIGTSWAIFTTGGYAGTLRVNGVNDNAEATTDEVNKGIGAVAAGTYPSADYKVQATMEAPTFSGTNPGWGLIARYADASNYYSAFITRSNLNPDIQINKFVAGVSTILLTGNLGIDIAVSHVYRFEAQGTALRFYVDDVLKLSTTDSALSAAGKGGFGEGTSMDHFDMDAHTAFKIENFSVQAF